MGAYDDLFGPFKRLIPLKILGAVYRVPEGNVLLRCLQYIDLAHRALSIDYIHYCWSNQCGNCELSLSIAGADPKRTRACQFKVREGLEITELPRHIGLASFTFSSTLTGRDLAPYLRNPSDAGSDLPVVRIHRRNEDRGQVRTRLLEIPAGEISGEFFRTRGHYRSLRTEAGMTYPALLRVVAGRALLLQQRSTLAPEAVSDLLTCHVEPGASAVLLPDFAEVIVNPGSETLLVEISESPEVRHEHEPIRRFRGPAFYPGSRGGDLHLIPNVQYAELTTPRWIRPREAPELHLAFGDAAPVTADTHPWLARPEEIFEDLSKAYEYL